MTLQGSVAFAFHRNAVVLYVGLSALAGSQDDVDGIPFGFRHIAFVEFLFVPDLYDLEAFLDEIGGELPQLFKAAVAVEDSRKVFGRVVGGDPEIVRHTSWHRLRVLGLSRSCRSLQRSKLCRFRGSP